MKKLKIMKAVTLPAILLSFVVSMPAFAGIKRSCSATVTVSPIQSSSGPSFISYTQGTFSATRGCGSLVPNRCRERARSSLNACFRAAVASPDIDPFECRGAVKGYNIGRLARAIRKSFCNAAPVFRNHTYDVNVTLRTRGGTSSCSGTVPGKRSIRFSTKFCPR